MIGDIPEALASKLFIVMQEWEIYKATATVSDQKCKALKETWTFGVGIGKSCKYFLYVLFIHKIFVCKKLQR